MTEHATAEELLAGLDDIRAAPSDRGTVELIVRRPAVDEREVVEEGELDLVVGLIGDRWHLGASPIEPDAQLTLMNARAAELIAGDARALAARRRPALRRPRPQRRQPARRARGSQSGRRSSR